MSIKFHHRRSAEIKVLKARRITADVLQLGVNEKEPAETLFGNEQEPSKHVVPDSPTKFPQDVVNGNTSIVFAHPEALLSKEGRELMASKVFNNVVACIVDEAHCDKLW